MPTDERTDLPDSLDERSLLLTMLDYTRRTAIAKCAGLSDDDARRRVLPTSPVMTMSGVISHLRWVEWSWIHDDLLGEPDEGPWTNEEPDREFTYRVADPLTDVIADYEAVARAHEELFRRLDLDQVSVGTVSDGRHVTFRWILHHLIEENARHNGHLDIMRELIDGTTGT